MTDAKKPAKQEAIKEESNYLKGNIAEELADTSTEFVSNESYELLKFHGSYQGYDRDTATARKKAGLDKEWEFMLRMKCPAGRLTADQYLALDDIAEKYANGTLRLTTRQTFQFHCIAKGALKPHIAALNKAMISTLGGCGDVIRNINACPAPINDVIHNKLLEDALALAELCAPKTTAYHEIWVDGENLATTNQSSDEIEPLYGKFYLPRKFKIGLAVPEDNTIDALTHDLGIIPLFEGDTLLGYNFYLGGGQGMTHNKPETFPRMASPIAFIQPDDLEKATVAVIKLQRDHGDRSNRKRARLKYVIEDNGLEWARTELEKYFGSPLKDPKPVEKFAIVDHMGLHSQKDGKYYLGVPISSGRILDRGEEKIRTGLRETIKKHQVNILLTADQNIILCDIPEKSTQAVQDNLRSYGIKLREDISSLYRNTMACVSLPTCGKALAEAERIKLPLVEEIDTLLEKHGIAKENIALRIAGCPNGCSRPYAGEIGIVGRTPGIYSLFIGGDFEGTRLSPKVLDKVPYDNITDVLDLIFEKFSNERNDNEAFGAFAHRTGTVAIQELIGNNLGTQHKWAKS